MSASASAYVFSVYSFSFFLNRRISSFLFVSLPLLRYRSLIVAWTTLVVGLSRHTCHSTFVGSSHRIACYGAYGGPSLVAWLS